MIVVKGNNKTNSINSIYYKYHYFFVPLFCIPLSRKRSTVISIIIVLLPSPNYITVLLLNRDLISLMLIVGIIVK